MSTFFPDALLTEEEVVTLLKDAGALLSNGHFRLASGQHSTDFVAKTNAATDVMLIERLARDIALRHVEDDIDTVLAPGTGAISLGHAVAYHIGELIGRPVHCVFALRPVVDPTLTLKRGFADAVRGKRVIPARGIGTLGPLDPLFTIVRGNGGEPLSYPLNLSSAAPKLPNWPRDIFADPAMTRDMVDGIERSFALLGDLAPDVVLVEAGLDIAAGHAFALRFPKQPKLIYAEPTFKGQLTIGETFLPFVKKKRLLVVDDIVTTGASLRETIVAGIVAGGRLAKWAALWNRGSFADSEFTALVTRQLPTYAPGPGCPGCDSGVPISTQFGRGPVA